MSIINQDAQKYLRLKYQQHQLEKQLQQVKQAIKPYEDNIEDYLLKNNKIIQVNQNMKIRVEQTTPYEPLSFKYLENSFEKVIHNPNQRKQLLQFLKENRARNLKTKVVIDF